MDGLGFNVFVVLGDGEMNTGQVWETAMFAAFRKLAHVIIIARIIKRKGISFAEGDPAYHNGSVTEEPYGVATGELDSVLAALQD